MDCSLPGILCPWDSPGKNTGVGCHVLLQGIFLTQESNSGLLSLLYWQAGPLPRRHWEAPARRMDGEYLPSIYGLPFYSLSGVFWKTISFQLLVVQYIHLSIMVSAFGVLLRNLCLLQILPLETLEARKPLKVVYLTGLEKWGWLSFFFSPGTGKEMWNVLRGQKGRSTRVPKWVEIYRIL